MNNWPDIFTFSDYRQYLRAWLDEARARQVLNLSRLAKAIDVHTTFLAHVLSGTKNLSFEQATEVSEQLNHTAFEREYFFALLQIERAGSAKLEKYWMAKLEGIQKEHAKLGSRIGIHHELTSEERATFYSSWIFVAIFVATAIDNGQTLEQIAERFSISRDKAEEILLFLVRTGVCEKADAIYKMGTSVIYLSNDSPLVVKHHTNWRVQAIQKMDTRDAAEVFYTSPMSISKEDFLRIREILLRTIQSAHEICRTSPAEEVVCLNMDFFRLAGK